MPPENKKHKPLWVMGENGAEIPFDARYDLDCTTAPMELSEPEFNIIEMDGCELSANIDKHTLRKLKWAFLKSAIKFFFAR